MTEDLSQLRKRLEELTSAELEEILADDGSGFVPEARLAAQAEMERRSRLPELERQALASTPPAALGRTPWWRKVLALVLLWAGGTWLFALGREVVEALFEAAVPHPFLVGLLGLLGGVSIVAGRALWGRWRRVLGIAVAVAALFHLLRGLTAGQPQSSLTVILTAAGLGLAAAALVLRGSGPPAPENPAA